MKLSDCCGAPAYSMGGDFEDSGICSECREHCEYEETEEQEQNTPTQKINSCANNLTPYEEFQLTVYGNILPPVGSTKDEDLFESGIEELNRLAEWTEYMNELELIRE